MKRWFTLLFVVILVSCTLEASSKPVEVTQPDPGQRFKIYQSLIFSHPDGKDTYLRVILCTDRVEELDEIFNEIKIFHEHMNGVSNSLTITLYPTKMELLECKELGEKIFKKENEKV